MVNPGSSGSQANSTTNHGAWERGAGGSRTDGGGIGNHNANFGGGASNNNGDAVSKILELHHSEFPGQILVTKPLMEHNYNSWMRAMKLALGANKKLRFVEGAVPKPEEDDPNFEQWTIVDAMVTSWLLNSISTYIAEGFMYAESSIEIWKELRARFGVPNVTEIFQLQQEIGAFKQGNSSLGMYYNKLKGLWDKLSSVDPSDVCTCGVARKIACKENMNGIIKFLMGLNEEFEGVRDNVLTMDPMPDILKVFNIVLQVENKKNTHHALVVDNVQLNQTAFYVGSSSETIRLHFMLEILVEVSLISEERNLKIGENLRLGTQKEVSSVIIV